MADSHRSQTGRGRRQKFLLVKPGQVLQASDSFPLGRPAFFTMWTVSLCMAGQKEVTDFNKNVVQLESQENQSTNEQNQETEH